MNGGGKGYCDGPSAYRKSNASQTKRLRGENGRFLNFAWLGISGTLSAFTRSGGLHNRMVMVSVLDVLEYLSVVVSVTSLKFRRVCHAGSLCALHDRVIYPKPCGS